MLRPNFAPSPALGTYADGFGPLARVFAEHLASGQEIGAALAIHQRGELVVDLWGGLADVTSRRPWTERSRINVFSATKGLAAMALHLLADRGRLAWDVPVATYWPGFARNGKEDLSVRTLIGHRGGLSHLDTELALSATIDPARRAEVLEALEVQRPAWRPGEDQGYHAITFGLYAKELFERVAGESMGRFLRRELLEPLGSDFHLGTPAALDDDVATLYPPSAATRLVKTLATALLEPHGHVARVARDTLRKDSLSRRAFLNPHIDLPGGIAAYNGAAVRRGEMPWGNGTASARGLSRAYLPFASRGVHAGKRYLREESFAHAYRRDGWSERDRVLHKPLGWTCGFLKEELHVFSPVRESFGHAGMGGALGWCDPVNELTFGYVMNRMDFRVRSLRALALCHALYDSPAIRDASR
ncbi:MAG: serine hydrolase domain-containing protein [Deltaproteobacteria bacterium]|jgi:CubicO group peptidase (beta-lactamase class C family)